MEGGLLLLLIAWLYALWPALFSLSSLLQGLVPCPCSDWATDFSNLLVPIWYLDPVRKGRVERVGLDWQRILPLELCRRKPSSWHWSAWAREPRASHSILRAYIPQEIGDAWVEATVDRRASSLGACAVTDCIFPNHPLFSRPRRLFILSNIKRLFQPYSCPAPGLIVYWRSREEQISFIVLTLSRFYQQTTVSY